MCHHLYVESKTVRLTEAERRKGTARGLGRGNWATGQMWELGTPLPFSGPRFPPPSEGLLAKMTCQDVVSCVRLCVHDLFYSRALVFQWEIKKLRRKKLELSSVQQVTGSLKP